MLVLVWEKAWCPQVVPTMGAGACLSYGHRFVCVGGPLCPVVDSVAFKQISRIGGKDDNKDGAAADPAYGSAERERRPSALCLANNTTPKKLLIRSTRCSHLAVRARHRGSQFLKQDHLFPRWKHICGFFFFFEYSQPNTNTPTHLLKPRKSRFAVTWMMYFYFTLFQVV